MRAMSQEVISLVCNACWEDVFNTKAIEDFWNQNSYGFSYSTTWAQIAQSADKACNWCSFLNSVLPSPSKSGWPKMWTPDRGLTVILGEAYLMSNATPKGLNQCGVDFCSEGTSSDWYEEFDLFIDDTEGSAGIVTARPLQTKVNSSDAYRQIQQWLDQCNRHPKCGNVSSYNKLPSRVIEVAPVSSPDVPCLRGTNGLKGSYLALSYCWGSEQSYVLTTKTMNDLMEGLNVQSLPQTICDAISITKTLGFRYLWVDALCIMQDSDSSAARHDKDKELANMHQVYNNATMTIVASSAASVTEGFLQDRPTPHQRIFDIPCRIGPDHFFVAHIKEHFMSDDVSEPINKRAWTFQEEILSPRLLIYASHTLQWQCRTLTCNVGGSYHAPNPSAAPRLPSPQMLLLDEPPQPRGRHELEPDIPHYKLQHWLDMVRCSSMRTYKLLSDKLPVVSALASSYAPIFGSDYHAGIWGRSAMQQLCWRNADSRKFFTRPKQYRAPSWSWASVDGPLYFPSYLEIDKASAIKPYPDFRILTWLTLLKSASVPFGEVTGGELVVTSVLRDALLELSSSISVTLHTTQSTESEQSQIAHGICDVADDSFSRPVRCLAMYHPHQLQAKQIGGLMLVQLSGYDSTFRRIGSFTADAEVFCGIPTDTVTVV